MIDQILSTARAEIGYREKPVNITKYGEWYGFHDLWCAMFVSWVFDKAGYPLPKIQQDAPSGAAYCPYIETYARRVGQWHGKPMPGDLALYHFGQPLAIHIGIVESVGSGGNFTAIEGNTKKGNGAGQNNGEWVWRRSRHRSQCRGFYRPFDLKAQLGKDAYYRLIRLQKPFMAGNDIREWQKQVNFWAIAIEIDGVYGPESEKACRTLQGKWGLEVDGIVGPKTWERTFRSSKNA